MTGVDDVMVEVPAAVFWKAYHAVADFCAGDLEDDMDQVLDVVAQLQAAGRALDRWVGQRGEPVPPSPWPDGVRTRWLP
ncbi:hypothetical protein [Euzebya pacifica]|uniref:hypothetical protein n=1 Tax=Euzebya pacifica TaxID=1608957 RepID=UPI000DF7F157|nr:hypothetical protein [Euzebya pacifica]